MRAILVLILCGLALSGCKHPKPETAQVKPTEPKTTVKAAVVPKNPTVAAPKPSPPPVPRATAVNDGAGKVASVNANLRFVVIDFALNRPPQADQRLSVFRDGQKVGEVKISSQARNSIVAADITAGEARVGDEVRGE